MVNLTNKRCNFVLIFIVHCQKDLFEIPQMPYSGTAGVGIFQFTGCVDSGIFLFIDPNHFDQHLMIPSSVHLQN
jgi:hypothetical protein